MKRISFALASSAMLIGIVAQAQTNTRQVGDWKYWETTDGVCVIETNNGGYQPGGGDSPVDATAYLKISKVKNKLNMPVEVMVQLTSSGSRSKGVVASISGANSMAMPDLDGGNRTFWGVPKGLSQFVNQLKNKRTSFTVKGVGGRREEITLTTSGFSDIVREMEANCNSGNSIVNQDFESKFFVNVADSLAADRIDVKKTQDLRGIYHAAYNAAFNISNASNDLAALLARYQPFIDELKLNRDENTDILNVKLPAAKKVLADAKDQQVNALAEIKRVNDAVPGLNAKIAASQKAYDTAQAILAPHVPEYNRITSQLASAQSTLNSSLSRLAYIDQRIPQANQEIGALENEARSLESNLPGKVNELNNARQNADAAERARSNFNKFWERDSRIRDNWEHRRLRVDIDNVNRRKEQTESESRRLMVERSRVEAELNRCRQGVVVAEPQAVMLSATVAQIVKPGPGGGRPGGPGNGGPGNGGGGVTPGNPGGGGSVTPVPPGNPGQGGGVVAPRDCSKLEQALIRANDELRRNEGELRQANSEIDRLVRRMRDIERQIDYDVQREYDRLAGNAVAWQNAASQLSSEVSSMQNRVSQVRGSEIPRRERELTQLQSERPQVSANISNSQMAISQLSAELTQFKNTTDWDRKAANVDSTAQQLAADQAVLSQELTAKRVAESSLAAGARTEAQTKAQIDSLNARVVALDKRAVELDAKLAQLPGERAQFDVVLAQQKVELESRTNQFAALLK